MLAARDLAYLRDLLVDFGILIDSASAIWSDSGSAVKMAFDPVSFRNTKHIMRAAEFLRDLVARGEQVYLANCAACHRPDGKGLTGAFPPLAGSDYLRGDRSKVLGAAMFGLSGPITVNGVDYNGVMPSLAHLSDEDLAAALTYVLSSWGNDGAAVSVEEVAALRAEGLWDIQLA